MPRVVNDWEVDDKGNAYRYFDPYPDQERREGAEYPPYVGPYPERRAEEGQVTAARANIIMLAPYLQSVNRRWYSVKINIGKLYGRR